MNISFPYKAFITSILFAAIYSPVALSEQVRYISDVVYVPLRSGQGNEFRILDAGMRSGTKLTLLEESADGDWAKVANDAGLEGWVRTQYLMAEAPAMLKLDDVIAKKTQLEQSYKTLQEKNRALTTENNALQAQVNQQANSEKKLASELQNIKSLTTTSRTIKLDKDYRELLEKHQFIQTERDALMAENDNLKSDQRMDYMLYGAGLLILGIIIAILLPSLLPKKGYSEWR